MGPNWDVIVIGAGAAGLFAGIEAARRGRRTLVLDHSAKPAEKIRISGGGRCNFTNIHTTPDRFLSDNPHFAKSALARYTPDDFMDRMRAHGLTWHEKTLGQLFCDQKSGAVIEMLLEDLHAAGGTLRLGASVEAISKTTAGYSATGPALAETCTSLIIATGGLSIPKIGATGFAYDIARQFDHHIIEPRAGLVPFVFTDKEKAAFAILAGVSQRVRASTGGQSFEENLLFTHRGLSGPVMLQLSSYWKVGQAISIDTLAHGDLFEVQKTAGGSTVATALGQHMSARLRGYLCTRFALPGQQKLAEMSADRLQQISEYLHSWRVKPAGTEGWRTAEVTVGGVNTNDLSSKTMESRHAAGLYFIGECVDVTGWLGGYNFQWAWASGWVAGQSVA